MNKFISCVLLFVIINSIHAQQIEKYLIETEIGDIELEVYPEKAPITVENFRAYVEKGLYANSSFFRVCTPENEADREIKIEVIQGGNVPDSLLLAPIPIETSEVTGVKHKNGTISMARLGPNTAQSSFLFVLMRNLNWIIKEKEIRTGMVLLLLVRLPREWSWLMKFNPEKKLTNTLLIR